MTEENKKDNIKNELERASNAFKAANLLYDSGLLNDAVSRLYYFLLHNIRALLLSRGLNQKAMKVHSGFSAFIL
jgi:uncharacterized protein (UPF0332 family)